MRKCWSFAVFALIASSLVAAELLAREPLPDALKAAIDATFADSRLVARSPACQSDVAGPVQIGLVIEKTGKLHAVLAVAAPTWVLWDLPRKVAYKHGAAGDFLAGFSAGRFEIDPRCTSPGRDPDIDVASNGQFISHRGEGNLAKHVCFPASDVYNGWVCYWTKPGTGKPLLSFVQINAD